MRRSAELVCHADARSAAVDRIDVRWLAAQRTLSVVFTAVGAIGDLRVPPPAKPRRVDGLWRHTCFELFVGRAAIPAYYEFNFSPSGEWAAYAFRDYREPETFELGVESGAAASITDERLQLEAFVRFDQDSFAPGEALRLGLSAVIEDRSGCLTYWALRHRPGAPDFHHPDGLALRLVWV
jgi:hypothetical protein